ncbi:MAG: ABC transporter ATP-binding protein [Desulfobacterota bacterium]|nr:ABC transporter ATP-binding protein [Thermodesulfobacteriota bacterium]
MGAIELRNLTKTFGNRIAVNRINLTVKEGEIFGFIGPNGAGKTTTLKMISGILSPTEGTVMIDGIDMAKEPEKAKQRLGYIPDRPFLYEKLTGMEFLRFTADLYGLEEDRFWERAEIWLDIFSLTDWRHELIESYSHGMKQRLVFAAALLREPKVLIIDEPMVGLDPAGMRLIKRLFVDLVEKGTTLFLSTHLLSVAEELCHRIGVIHRGNLISTGTIGELKASAQIEEGDLEKVFLILTEGEGLL